MNFNVRLSRSAEHYVERLPSDVQTRILERLAQIADKPFGQHTKPLQGGGGRRGARVGALRIVFTVDRDQHVVDVSDSGPRGQVYRRL